MVAVDQSLGDERSRINWSLVWTLMDRKRSIDEYRKKYRSGLLPSLKRNRLKSESGNQNLEYALDEDESDTTSTSKDKQILPKRPKFVRKRVNHYWTEEEV